MVRSVVRSDHWLASWVREGVDAAGSDNPDYWHRATRLQLDMGRGDMRITLIRSHGRFGGAATFPNNAWHHSGPPEYVGLPRGHGSRADLQQGRVGPSWLHVAWTNYWSAPDERGFIRVTASEPAEYLLQMRSSWVAIPLPLVTLVSALPIAWWLVRRR